MSKGKKIPDGPPEAFDPEHDLLSWLEENFTAYGDIYRASIFGKNAYVASSPYYAQYVLRNNWSNYRKGQAIKRVALLLGNGLMVSEGEFWLSQRRMIQPAFARNFVSDQYDVMKTANFKLLERWTQSALQAKLVNVTSDTSLLVLEITLRAVFGDDYPIIASFFKIVHDEPSRNLAFAESFVELRRVVVELVRRRRARNQESLDILGILMKAHDHSGRAMPEDQLVKEITTIIVAGHETTASTLNMIWYLLSQNPEVEIELSAELETLAPRNFPQIEDLQNFTYTRQVIDEALRLYPPGWLMTRKAINDDWLGEYFVPAGTEVYISPYIIQRHPALWIDPGLFWPERFNCSTARERRSLETLPFSAGPRNCIGEYLARTEIQVHLTTFANRVRLRYIDDSPLEFEAGVNLRSKHEFLMMPELKT